MPTKTCPFSRKSGPIAAQISWSRGGQADLFWAPADMHVGANLARCRDAVDGANRFAVNKDDPFVAVRDIRQKFLRDQRLVIDAGEQLVQAGKVTIIRTKAENTCATIAIKRL